ncbi:MAG TPA: alpha/beta hydrolase [Actinomycetota bacterium]|nr:alpha/beta hydrolase [Actinomycetota bacterium]
MPEFDHDGWRLHYEDAGDGPPVLLAHGLLFDGRQFVPQVAALSDRWRIVTPDARNHGQSEFRAEPYTQWDLMEDHIALLDHLDIDRAVWGGVSMGGFQSLRAALRYPDRVAGLVLIDSQAGAELDMAPMYEAAADLAVEDGWTDDSAQLAGSVLFGASASDELKREWIDWWQSVPTHSARELIQAVTRRDDITERLGEIDVPAIVIHGEEDVAIPMERAEVMARGLPSTMDFVRIERGGHTSTLEQPDAVTEVVERFLTKVWPA